MMYRKYSGGIIEVITGPMFSGKSEELIKRIKILLYAEVKTLIVKPSIDGRFSKEKITSRNGTSIKSHPVEIVEDIKELFRADDYKAVVIDEVQFFDDEIINYVDELANEGIHVIVCGLDQDYKRRPFSVTANLMGIADNVTKLKAVCFVCKMAASCSFRISKSESTIEVGDSDKYEARCRSCHEKGMKERKKQKLKLL